MPGVYRSSLAAHPGLERLGLGLKPREQPGGGRRRRPRSAGPPLPKAPGSGAPQAAGLEQGPCALCAGPRRALSVVLKAAREPRRPAALSCSGK